MQVIHVKQINEDGSVAFEGNLGPNEVRYILEQGLNYLFQAGVEVLEAVEEEATPNAPSTDTVQ